MACDDPACLPTLRRRIATLLADAHEDLRSDAELVATELVTNAIEHAKPPRKVHIRCISDAQVHIAVTDNDAQTLPAFGRSTLGVHRGRGLVIVDHLSADWGVANGAATKTVWATLGGR